MKKEEGTAEWNDIAHVGENEDKGKADFPLLLKDEQTATDNDLFTNPSQEDILGGFKRKGSGANKANNKHQWQFQKL